MLFGDLGSFISYEIDCKLEQIRIMKQLLIPTDLMPTSDNVWQYALHLVKHETAHLHFVHAVDDIFVKEERDHIGAEGVDKITSDLIYKMRAEADAAMEKLLERIRATLVAAGHEHTVSGAVRNGNPEEVILHEAAEIQPQLIIMGSHNHSKLERMVFGSVTRNILTHAQFPVLAIPNQSAYAGVHDVLYMSDLHPEDVYAIGKLINIFRSEKYKLHIAHFHVDGDSKEAALYDLASSIKKEYSDIAIDFEVVDARILRDAYMQYIEHKNIALIALTHRKTHGMQSWLKQSTAVDVLYHGKRPVLVFQTKE